MCPEGSPDRVRRRSYGCRKVSTLDRGCCCSFSSRRIYIPNAKVIIGPERVASRMLMDRTGCGLLGPERLTAICLLADDR
jgi:hypothetical protein